MKRKYNQEGPSQLHSKKQDVSSHFKATQEYKDFGEYAKEETKKLEHYMRVNPGRDVEQILIIMQEESIGNLLNQPMAIERLVKMANHQHVDQNKVKEYLNC